MSSKRKKVYEEYLFMHNLKPTDLPQELFEKVVFIFPLLLVAKADGHIDTTELIFLDKLLKRIYPNLSEKEYETLRQRMRIFILELKFWKEKMFETLRELLDTEEKKKLLSRLLIETANSSSDDIVLNILAEQEEELKENFISAEEKEMLMEIANALNLPYVEELLKENSNSR